VGGKTRRGLAEGDSEPKKKAAKRKNTIVAGVPGGGKKKKEKKRILGPQGRALVDQGGKREGKRKKHLHKKTDLQVPRGDLRKEEVHPGPEKAQSSFGSRQKKKGRKGGDPLLSIRNLPKKKDPKKKKGNKKVLDRIWKERKESKRGHL